VTEFPSFNINPQIESLKLVVNRQFIKPISIIALHRPKKLPVGEFRAMEKVFASHCDGDTYVIGDLNLDFSLPMSPECLQFRSKIFQHGFEQITPDPTHHYTTGDLYKQSVIDLIITNCKSSEVTSGVITCSFSSDHDLVYAVRRKVNLKTKARLISYRPIKSCDSETINTIINKLSSAPWWVLDLCPNINEVFKVVNFIFSFILDSTLPTKTVRAKSNQPKWLTP